MIMPEFMTEFTHGFIDKPDGVHENGAGNKFWIKDRKLHREDGPAYLYSSGTEWWMQYGQFHRIDGPAIVGSNMFGARIEAWYRNGQLHEPSAHERFLWESKKKNSILDS